MELIVIANIAEELAPIMEEWLDGIKCILFVI
jgi:hypothetical protein